MTQHFAAEKRAAFCPQFSLDTTCCSAQILYRSDFPKLPYLTPKMKFAFVDWTDIFSLKFQHKVSILDSEYLFSIGSIIIDVLSQRVGKVSIFYETQSFCPCNVKSCRPAQDYFLRCLVSLFLDQLQCLIASNSFQSI